MATDPTTSRELEDELARSKAKLREVELAASEARSEARQNATRFGYAYRRLRAAVEGKAPSQLGPAAAKAPTPEDSKAHVAATRKLYSRGVLVDHLAAGEPLEDAVAAAVRAQIKAGEPATARSLAQALQTNPATRVAGLLGSGLVAYQMNHKELAWANFREIPREVWSRLAPAEYFRTVFRVDGSAAAAEARGLLADRPDDLSPVGWLSFAKAALGAGQEDLAREIFETAEELAGQDTDAWASTVEDRDWLRPWFDPVTPDSPHEGALSIAVLDYKQPDRKHASIDLGDYIQTLAGLGHIVRHRNLRFQGPDDLVELATDLQHRVPSRLSLETDERDVLLVPVHRDASGYSSIPRNTWVIASGRFMHSVFGRYDFPLNRNLSPIFISFHCDRRSMLSPEAIDYLREHSPIGCRDWTTVDLLLSAGVPAFFSGCITTTTSTLFADLDESERAPADAPVAYVGLDAPANGVSAAQVSEEVRDTGLVVNLRRAIDLFEDYRRHYAGLVTSRLHCYVPARSVGASVDFRPENPADPRFNGLSDLSETDYEAMRQGFLAKLGPVSDAIIAGKERREVYAIWRDVCAADVALAKARHASVPRIPAPSFDIRATCERIRGDSIKIERSVPSASGKEVHIALALDGNLKNEMNVVVEAMTENCSRPLHLWILCREHSQADFDRFSSLFPEVSATWLPCDAVDYRPIVGMLRHVTVSCIDRLLLPDLLVERDRVIYHDIDALPLGDVAQLYEWDLQENPLAARSVVATHFVSGFSSIARSAAKLREDPAKAHDLILRMHSRHKFDFVAFNAGILVMDLERMRADEFGREFVPFVEQYGMNDQEILNCYIGPNRAVLPPAWNSLPTQEVVTDPKIIHWAGPQKPWKQDYVRLQDVWASYQDRLRLREKKRGLAA